MPNLPKNILIIHPHDITFDDLEALVLEYEHYLQKGMVRYPSLPDHYLAYLILQSHIPFPWKEHYLDQLVIDHDFFAWVIETHPVFQNKNFRQKRVPKFELPDQDSLLSVFDDLRNRTHQGLNCEVIIPPLALEHLASGILDYFDPVKEFVNIMTDFLNLLHQITYEYPAVNPTAYSNLTQLLPVLNGELEKLLDIMHTQRLDMNREMEPLANVIAELQMRLKTFDLPVSADNYGYMEKVREITGEILKQIIRYHGCSRIVSGEIKISINIIDTNTKIKPGRTLSKVLKNYRNEDTYVMISAMSAELPLGLAMGRALELYGIRKERIVYGGMAFNSFLPRNQHILVEIMENREKLTEMLSMVDQVLGVHTANIFFGFFDRPGAKRFLNKFFNNRSGDRITGYGVRMSQDGTWLDPQKSRYVTWHGRYISRVFGVPAANILKPVMISGSCKYKCSFCASLGSMALSNQRTAEDVLEELKSYHDNLSWLRTYLGDKTGIIKRIPVLKQIIGFLDHFYGGNISLIDDNLAAVHPWTIGLLNKALYSSRLHPAIYSLMDVNTIMLPEHREFIKNYLIGSFLGIEALKTGHFKSFTKAAAELSVNSLKKLIEVSPIEWLVEWKIDEQLIREIFKEGFSGPVSITSLPPLERKKLAASLTVLSGFQNLTPEQRAKISELAFTHRFIATLEERGIMDRLLQSYYIKLSRFINIGVIPINALILGLHGHDDPQKTVREMIDFVNSTVGSFGLQPVSFGENLFLKTFSRMPFMTYQVNFLSVFAGSPDANLTYPFPWQRNDGDELKNALKNLMIPGGWRYDLPRMTGQLPQANLNAFRALLELSSDYQLERFDPEDSLLSQYFIDRTLSSPWLRLKAGLGAFVVSFTGKRHHRFSLRLLYAIKASIITNTYRSSGRHKVKLLEKLLPVLRWQLYRKYVKFLLNTDAAMPKHPEDISHLGFTFDGLRIGLVKKEQFISGLPNWVYQRNGLDRKSHQFPERSVEPKAFFRVLFRNFKAIPWTENERMVNRWKQRYRSGKR